VAQDNEGCYEARTLLGLGSVSVSDMPQWLTLTLMITSNYEVLAQVLEEAGYTKDSFLVLSDFMKVLKQLISSITCCTGILKFHLGLGKPSLE
ncbi:hypothetical protein L195_g035998, partial [Trifolium pratense]